MSKFVDNVTKNKTGAISYMESALKKLIAANYVPFTVTQVDGPITKEVTNRRSTRKQQEFVLHVTFSDEDVKRFQEQGLQQDMLLSFTTGIDTVSRDARILDLQTDTIDEGPVTGVVLLYDPAIGEKGYYNISHISIHKNQAESAKKRNGHSQELKASA